MPIRKLLRLIASFGIGVLLSGTALAAAPSLSVSVIPADGHNTVRVENVYSAPVDAYILVAEKNAPSQHQWRVKVYDSLLGRIAEFASGAAMTLNWDLDMPVEAWNLRLGVLYGDGVSAGDMDLLGTITSERARTAAMISAIKDALRQTARKSQDSTDLLDAIAAWRTDALKHSASGGVPLPEARFQLSAFRQGIRDAAIRGKYDLALYSLLSDTVAGVAAAFPTHTPQALAEDVSARLDSLVTEMNRRRGL